MGHRWMGVTTMNYGPNGESYWWHDKAQQWLTRDQIVERYGEGQGGYGTHTFPRLVRSVKAFKRFVRKHSAYLPAGIEFCLCSRYIGHCVYMHTRKPKEKVRS